MSQTVPLDPSPLTSAVRGRGALLFIGCGFALACASFFLAGWTPLSFSIVTVFLFAGPHNWLEFRYLLTRMPAHWGRQRAFFSVALAGALGISLGFIGLYALGESLVIGEDLWTAGYSLLQTVFILWVATLAHLRSRLAPRRDWAWVWPLAFLFIALSWLSPSHWGMGLVYLHPLMALWLLDRELRRSRPAWRPAFHALLATLPLFLGLLWWQLATVPDLYPEDELSRRITDHVGSGLIPGIPSRTLVATHAFLEMLHYGVWVVAMPLIGLGVAPWNLGRIPLAYRGSAWKLGLALFLLLGFSVVVVLWGCFLADYTTTRVAYFIVAIIHVLAEFPFLLRSL